MKLKQWMASSLLVLASLAQGLQAAEAQNIPPSVSPGALLQAEQNSFFMRQNFPYNYGPITRETLFPPQPKDVITIEDGVFLNDEPQTGVQGVLMTPDGKVIISPRD